MFFDVYSSLCESKQKTPNGVAKELGFASASVTQWKHGSTPRPIALQKIADYFGVGVHYLLGAEQKEKSPTPEGMELTNERIKEMLNQMSAADLAQLIADCADEMRKRNAKQ